MSIQSNRPLTTQNQSTVPDLKKTPSVQTPQPTGRTRSNTEVTAPPQQPVTGRSRSQSSPNLVGDLKQQEKMVSQSIDQIEPEQILENAQKVPRLGSLPKPLSVRQKGRPVFSETEVNNMQQHKVLKGFVKTLAGSENLLRSHKTKKAGLQQLKNQVKLNLGKLSENNSPESNLKALDDMQAYFRGKKPHEMKSELAKLVGGLRVEKYGINATYRELSTNKKAMVDTIYKEVMRSMVDETGDLDTSGVDLQVSKLGQTARLKEKMTLGNKTYEAGQRVLITQRDGKSFVQVMEMPELSKNPGKMEKLKHKMALLKDHEVSEDVYPIEMSKVKDMKPLPKEKPIQGPLFDGPVSTSDIKQGAIGDCYLIAAMYSMASTNPDRIHEMMKDNGDNTVTVRFFEKNKNTSKMEPVFVTVDKSIPTGGEHAQETPWVVMLEKAYAVHKGSYQAIGHGGFSHNVFQTFTGISSTKKPINNLVVTLGEQAGRVPPESIDSFTLPKLLENKDELGLSEAQIRSLAKLPVEDLRNLFYGPQPEKFAQLTGLDEWKDFGKDVAEAKQAKFTAMKNNDPNKVELNSRYNQLKTAFEKKQSLLNGLITTKNREVLTTQMLESNKVYKALKNEPIVYKEDVDKIMTEMRSQYANKTSMTHEGQTFTVDNLISVLEKQMEGKYPVRDTQSNESGFTVDYNQKELELYDLIRTDLSQGKVLAVGSNKTIGVSQGSGHSGGESKVDGLAGQHAYSVLDTTVMNGRRFVRIANPWGGNYSRDYTSEGDGVKSKTFDQKDYSYQDNLEQDKGGIPPTESWVELRELATLFNNYYVTGDPVI